MANPWAFQPYVAVVQYHTDGTITVKNTQPYTTTEISKTYYWNTTEGRYVLYWDDHHAPPAQKKETIKEKRKRLANEKRLKREAQKEAAAMAAWEEYDQRF